MVGMPTRNANSVAAARLLVPARCAREDCRDDLRQADQDRDAPGDRRAIRLLCGQPFGAEHPHAADNQRPGDRRDRFGQFEAEPGGGETEYRSDQEGCSQLQRVVAIGGFAKTGRQLP
jgi:hypothetical protein